MPRASTISGCRMRRTWSRMVSRRIPARSWKEWDTVLVIRRLPTTSPRSWSARRVSKESRSAVTGSTGPMTRAAAPDWRRAIRESGHKRPFSAWIRRMRSRSRCPQAPWGYPGGTPPNVSIMPYFWAPNTIVYSALTTARLILGGFGATSSSWKWGLDGVQRRESQQTVTAFETAQESLACLGGNRGLAGYRRLDCQFHSAHARFRSPAGKCDLVRRSFPCADARQQRGAGAIEALGDGRRAVGVYNRQGGA